VRKFSRHKEQQLELLWDTAVGALVATYTKTEKFYLLNRRYIFSLLLFVVNKKELS